MDADGFFAALVPVEGCLLWPGSKDSDGYGAVWYEGVRIRAHRLAWALHHGGLPDWHNQRLVLDHAKALGCGPRRTCANVEHLRVTTIFGNTDAGRFGQMWREYRRERDRQEELALDQAYGYAADLALLRERGIVPPPLRLKDWMKHWWEREEAMA